MPSLDPQPYVHHHPGLPCDGLRVWREEVEGDTFEPRPEYSQNREDYPEWDL